MIMIFKIILLGCIGVIALVMLCILLHNSVLSSKGKLIFKLGSKQVIMSEGLYYILLLSCIITILGAFSSLFCLVLVNI